MKASLLIPVIAVASLLAVVTVPARTEPLTLPNDMMIDLPEDWYIDGPAEGEMSSDGIRRIQLACDRDRCAKTQETCTILLRNKKMDGADDGAKLRSLYDTPLQKYFRLRAVLRATGRDAELRKPLQLVRIGQREWYRVETDARHNYKSGLFAETVVEGRYVGAICKTCERDDIRYRDSQAILTSLRSESAEQGRKEEMAARP